MKKLLNGLVFTLLLLFAGWAWALDISPQNTSGKPGGLITVPIHISDVGNGLDISKLSFIIQFDENVLSFDDSRDNNGADKTGTLVDDLSVVAGKNIEPGKVKVSGVMFGNPVHISTDGLFLNLKFTANENAVTGSNLMLSDLDYDIINAISTDAVFTVNAGTPVLSVTPAIRNVPASSTATSFEISNTGTGTMDWTATKDADWISITPVSGTDNGIITVNYEANFGDARTAVIEITADGADNSPQTVEVRQDKAPDNEEFLNLPDIRANPGETVTIPITAANSDNNNIQSVYAVIELDKNIIDSVKKITSAGGILDGEYMFEKNIVDNGDTFQVIIAFAAKTDAYTTASGKIAEIQVHISENADLGDITQLTFAEAELNDSSIDSKNGSIEIIPETFEISGNVGYFKYKGPVPGVTVNLEGDKQHISVTGAQGNYTFSDLLTGSYEVTAYEKTGDFGEGLSALDASKILKYVVRKGSFDCYQVIAADVNQDNRITATDASEVAICSGKRDVEIAYCMNDDCTDWVFTLPTTACDDWPTINDYPTGRTYSPLDSDQTNQDFVAILLGDVTKNWTAANTSDRRRRASKSRKSEAEIEAVSCSSLTIPVVLDQEAQIEAIDIVVQFDKDVFEVTGATLTGGILEEWEGNLLVNTEADGLVSLKIYGSDEITGSGEVAFINFNVIGHPDSASTLSFKKFKVNESSVTGKFRTNDTTATEIKVTVSDALAGNINNDKIIDLQDAILGLKLLTGMDAEDVYPGAEVNCDGKTGMQEVIYVFQVVAGIRGEAVT
ncbi:MAG: hypothetical protein GY795_50370 [Desulfobacterales bacterium]|nr:hypothetical protein [Desulfobacterales bacterium]